MGQFDVDLSLLYQGRFYADPKLGMLDLQKDFQRAAARIHPIVASELRKHLQLIAQRLASKHGTAWPAGTTATTLSRRSGDAMQSLKRGVRVTSGPAGPVGEMHGAFYLMVHEYGAVIKPTRAQYLTIPLPEALNANGTPKRMNARQWNNTFVGQSRKGNLIIFQRRGRQIIPLYVLKKQVTIRKRLGLRQMQASAMDQFVNRVALLVTREITK